jgi:hypothetical protein
VIRTVKPTSALKIYQPFNLGSVHFGPEYYSHVQISKYGVVPQGAMIAAQPSCSVSLLIPPLHTKTWKRHGILFMV